MLMYCTKLDSYWFPSPDYVLWLLLAATQLQDSWFYHKMNMAVARKAIFRGSNLDSIRHISKELD